MNNNNLMTRKLAGKNNKIILYEKKMRNLKETNTNT